ncbi:hypothetical protein [Burkholderia pseudomallei]|uniref:hypothetical protein n=1 Tax=Burkholderia pseudomallei TaxID=28450 RepID=UPI001D0D2F9E|nr:hypothetical protein [Burkholderia pseudomallei]
MINIWDRVEGGEGEGGEAAACPPRGVIRGLAVWRRGFAVSPYRRIAVSPYRRIATSPIRHVADSTPAVRRARNMAAHRAKPRVAAEQRDTLDTPRA